MLAALLKSHLTDSQRRFTRLVVTGLLANTAIGCGGTESGPVRAAVEGVVAVDGQKLAAGVVRFIPFARDAGPATVAVVQEGTFRLPPSEGPVVGKHRVEIESTGHYGFEIDDEQAYAKSFQEKKGQALPPSPIPPSYNTQSTLTADVSADGPNKFEFQLQGTSNRNSTK